MLEKRYHEKCLITDAEDLVPLKGYEKYYLVKSRSSKFVFASKIPTVAELIAHYNTYERRRYVSPLTLGRYKELLKEFEPYRKNNRILDIGCGGGHFLAVAQEMGWEVYGTEYTDEAIAICKDKGINMIQGKLASTNYEPGYFDVITSFEVIEHINNPQEEVENIYKILRKGGLFYFTTPNFNALERYLLKDKYDVISYPEHLSYYTPKTIHFLLSKNQFEKKKILTTGISIFRLKNAFKKTKGEQSRVSDSSIDEELRNQFEKRWILNALKKGINWGLTLLGMGNSLKGYYVKK